MASSTALRVKELLRERGWTTKVLAEKTGMSESYLTHIKNGTRRWNEDALRKLADAFGIEPVELFVHRGSQKAAGATQVEIEADSSVRNAKDLALKVKAVPVMGEIPANPTPYNNMVTQVTTGFRDVYIPVFNTADENIFALKIDNSHHEPHFKKGDILIVSPAEWVKSGNYAAVEYGEERPVRLIAQVTYHDDFVIIQPTSKKFPPVSLIKGRDHFRIIGKVIYRYQPL